MLIFAPLRKIEDAGDTLYVEGIASSEALDAQGEIIQSAAIVSAIPDFMKLGSGALREMHGSTAAGTIDSVTVTANGETYVNATVVDPVAIRKVRTGTYKGFSVGGKVLARDPKSPKKITKIKLVEISLVDRPSNPEATISLWKAEGATSDPVSKAVSAVTSLEKGFALLDQRLSNFERVQEARKAAARSRALIAGR